ncbi:Hypothetical protein NTJ_11553 [Nesidiocoris tenuis]|uniref:Uncharacterized protein n=1 Tax=Nesidiocoris tenuis TaxID=355587 RepID=A0ABN7B548_9HEMI|nr:Hypothetical protein NTJ_11553 [Nesidiocoris tenuis]
MLPTPYASAAPRPPEFLPPAASSDRGSAPGFSLPRFISRHSDAVVASGSVVETVTRYFGRHVAVTLDAGPPCAFFSKFSNS